VQGLPKVLVCVCWFEEIEAKEKSLDVPGRLQDVLEGSASARSARGLEPAALPGGHTATRLLPEHPAPGRCRKTFS
jgi:hypothetical protein